MRNASIGSLVFMTLVACGGDKAPATATAVTPSPAPTPASTPVPTPVVFGQGLGCGLPAQAECGQVGGDPAGSPPGVYGCCTRAGVGQFRDLVTEAIFRLQAEQPSLFNGNIVLDRVAYQQGVARILERDFRVCAKPGSPGDEVAVKSSNDYSEQYDIYQSNARVFLPPSFQVSCRPARF